MMPRIPRKVSDMKSKGASTTGANEGGRREAQGGEALHCADGTRVRGGLGLDCSPEGLKSLSYGRCREASRN